ncbi:hypothetical protein DENSPDRAFT_433760 [Dentipellis sp. KUC8613]|nr:hypothetical protein DENSPDRAFT_433760 [Dentipellis sp. KUC8613]
MLLAVGNAPDVYIPAPVGSCSQSMMSRPIRLRSESANCKALEHRVVNVRRKAGKSQENRRSFQAVNFWEPYEAGRHPASRQSIEKIEFGGCRCERRERVLMVKVIEPKVEARSRSAAFPNLKAVEKRTLNVELETRRDRVAVRSRSLLMYHSVHRRETRLGLHPVAFEFCGQP